MPLPLTDTHVHLGMPEYAADLPAVLARSRSAGVARWIVPAIDSAGWAALPALHRQHAGLFYALGLHPWFLQAEEEDVFSRLETLLQRAPPGLVAIGECGLDAVVEVPMARQLAMLERQLDLACRYRLPVILHSRRTHNELLALLTRYRLPRGAVLHAFAGSRQQGEQFINAGCYLGIGGVITYLRADKTRKAVAALPQAALLLETDGPTMPLSGRQGSRNEPAFLPEVLTELAALRRQSAHELAAALEANVARCFFPAGAGDQPRDNRMEASPHG